MAGRNRLHPRRRNGLPSPDASEARDWRKLLWLHPNEAHEIRTTDHSDRIGHVVARRVLGEHLWSDERVLDLFGQWGARSTLAHTADRLASSRQALADTLTPSWQAQLRASGERVAGGAGIIIGGSSSPAGRTGAWTVVSWIIDGQDVLNECVRNPRIVLGAFVDFQPPQPVARAARRAKRDERDLVALGVEWLPKLREEAAGFAAERLGLSSAWAADDLVAGFTHSLYKGGFTMDLARRLYLRIAGPLTLARREHEAADDFRHRARRELREYLHLTTYGSEIVRYPTQLTKQAVMKAARWYYRHEILKESIRSIEKRDRVGSRTHLKAEIKRVQKLLSLSA